MVPLDAESCAREGGAPVMVTITPVSSAPVVPTPSVSTPVPPAPSAAEVLAKSAPLSSNPKLADAQRAIITMLDTSVLERDAQTRNPEGIERTANFDECRLTVNENVHIDHSKIFTSHMNFKINSTVDFRTLAPTAYGLLGKTDSLAGGLKAYSVYLEEYKHSSGNSLSVAMQDQYEGVYRKSNLPGPTPYWTTSRDDYFMADEYGYPTQNNTGLSNIATNKVRILFVVGSENEATALKKAMDDVRTLCK
ncbi:MAG: hypothetical protein WCD45_04685 [Gallionella sp.]